MFGFQRIGDLIWAAGDMKARGFLFGGTSGRTTLAGEGLQHQDGHSHLLAYPYPHVIPYDPAFAYELAVIIEDGLNQMCAGNNNHIRYITVYNESYTQVPAPRPIEEIREGILKGIYKFASVEPAKPAKTAKGNARINIFGSGAMLGEVRKAAKTLARCYGVSSDIWSVTSYKQLYTDAVSLDRKKLISGKPTEDSFIAKTLGAVNTPIVAVSDFVKAVPLSIAPWIKTPYYVLGTDGFGRSESRASLRDFFEVDRRYITLSAIQALVDEKILKKDVLLKARSNLEIDSFKKDPLSC
jgi:pyruvate dehydrogenase E1 component